MKQQLDEAKTKKPYDPPLLTAINLRPEEAVLGACKISGSAGAVSLTSCTALGAPCSNLGS